jgi:thiosulfate/3-mercaptopyruvate sulfurtransferase
MSEQKLLLEAKEVFERLEDPKVRLIDARPPDYYAMGHLKNSINIWWRQLTDPSVRFAALVAPVEKLELIFGQFGVENQSQLIIYDDGDGLAASRVFWTFDYCGHESISILNGGIAAWLEAGYELTDKSPSLSSVEYSASVKTEKLATKDWILHKLKPPEIKILDVRSPEEYTGRRRESKRGGRIPGAINVNWINAMADINGINKFKPPAELKQIYTKFGVSESEEIVTYCQLGIRASHTYFALRLAGFPRVRNYPGSWAEWGNDDSLPVEV